MRRSKHKNRQLQLGRLLKTQVEVDPSNARRIIELKMMKLQARILARSSLKKRAALMKRLEGLQAELLELQKEKLGALEEAILEVKTEGTPHEISTNK